MTNDDEVVELTEKARLEPDNAEVQAAMAAMQNQMLDDILAGMRKAKEEGAGFTFMLSVNLVPEQLDHFLAPEHPALPFLAARVTAEDFRVQAMRCMGMLLKKIEVSKAAPRARDVS